jgi:hypothetical protein
MMGGALSIIPYMIHKSKLVEKRTSQPHDKSCVDFVFQDLSTCGKKEITPKVPAAYPMKV